MRTYITDEGRNYLEQLETLRELALCGPEEQREKAQRAYEALRTLLLGPKQCETPDQTKVTKELD